ncbi:hypothetical protein Nwi_2304 [Nitrobacter winogradskyi Nb-255]|uniref:Uncharacterized protein n=1 Tax=Nitrobacter winogradskyi (strain ATCC 25391 / DSM 10237 / CIP 104748 / NCIMB 11846 / Nb-255) TaxID=323098 RepID=Q3SQ83_NITWN|nr:hypothetical protein Nwi_2304 [Nitrobacter winogradskyi Nb-255]
MRTFSSTPRAQIPLHSDSATLWQSTWLRKLPCPSCLRPRRSVSCLSRKGGASLPLTRQKSGSKLLFSYVNSLSNRTRTICCLWLMTETIASNQDIETGHGNRDMYRADRPRPRQGMGGLFFPNPMLRALSFLIEVRNEALDCCFDAFSSREPVIHPRVEPKDMLRSKTLWMRHDCTAHGSSNVLSPASPVATELEGGDHFFLNGRDRDTQAAGDLRIGHAVDLAEKKDALGATRQRLQRAQQRVEIHPARDGILRADYAPMHLLA